MTLKVNLAICNLELRNEFTNVARRSNHLQWLNFSSKHIVDNTRSNAIFMLYMFKVSYEKIYGYEY